MSAPAHVKGEWLELWTLAVNRSWEDPETFEKFQELADWVAERAKADTEAVRKLQEKVG